ncbi:MAG: exodeoxyribonuclease VII small subunit [Planctomycetaceae bacterium]|nr:exodeoxyribonuclease VII small subunit [Planctomycetaceae bacterium]
MTSKKRQKSESSLSFEAALGQLAEIVGELEDGSVGLEESLARFENGMRLLRHCHQVLSQAEQRIEQLTGFDAEGNPLTQPLESSATIDQRTESAGRRQRAPRPVTAEDGEEPPSPRLF